MRQWAGTAVLSVRAGQGSYRLAVQRGTAIPTVIPDVAPAPAPFDADIGPGPGGHALIVYTRCPPQGRCHLYRTDPVTGGEQLIPGAASTGGSESAPTVWGTRLAFARRYNGSTAVVYTRPLAAPASVPSRRLPGVPTRSCDITIKCTAVTDGLVPELELRGSTLAEIVRYGVGSIGICGQSEVRLVDLTDRSSREIAHTTCGLSGSTWLGLSLDRARLMLARTCPGDPAGCHDHATLAYRYDLQSHRTQTAAQPEILTGFAATDPRHALEIRQRSTPFGEPLDTSLLLAGPLPFAAG